jgi:hypothetical protein
MIAMLIGVCSVLILAGCPQQNSARGVADRFIEAYYVAISLKDAESLCTGLALSKIKQERQLTQGQVIDQSTRKPVVHYKLKDERSAQDRSTFLFLATIDVPDGGSFQRKWMITARKEGQFWKISNFTEYE